jgi:general stress protein 26
MTGDHQQHDQQPERFEELVGRFDHAMLVSVAEDLSDGTYLTVSGTASIVVERERIGELWRPTWRPWFPEGPQDPSLVILEIEAERAEYWDRTGRRRLEFLWEAGKALASGHRLDDDKLSGHHKFSFG